MVWVGSTVFISVVFFWLNVNYLVGKIRSKGNCKTAKNSESGKCGVQKSPVKFFSCVSLPLHVFILESSFSRSCLSLMIYTSKFLFPGILGGKLTPGLLVWFGDLIFSLCATSSPALQLHCTQSFICCSGLLQIHFSIIAYECTWFKIVWYLSFGGVLRSVDLLHIERLQ